MPILEPVDTNFGYALHPSRPERLKSVSSDWRRLYKPRSQIRHAAKTLSSHSFNSRVGLSQSDLLNPYTHIEYTLLIISFTAFTARSQTYSIEVADFHKYPGYEKTEMSSARSNNQPTDIEVLGER